MTDRTGERCDGRYPVPQTSPPRQDNATYRCGLTVGHEGPHRSGFDDLPTPPVGETGPEPFEAERWWYQRGVEAGAREAIKIVDECEEDEKLETVSEICAAIRTRIRALPLSPDAQAQEPLCEGCLHPRHRGECEVDYCNCWHAYLHPKEKP